MESGFRSTDWQQLTFAVVGMGLIGGSYAKALRRLGVKKIIGVDTDGKVLRQAQEQAVIDEALCGAGPGLQAADVVDLFRFIRRKKTGLFYRNCSLKQLYRAITKRPESLMIKNWKN